MGVLSGVGWEEGGVCLKGKGRVSQAILGPARHEPGWLDGKVAGRPRYEAVSPQDRLQSC